MSHAMASYCMYSNSMQDAFTQGPREKLLYLPVIVPDHSRPDYVVTIDADPQSAEYSKVLNYRTQSSARRENMPRPYQRACMRHGHIQKGT